MIIKRVFRTPFHDLKARRYVAGGVHIQRPMVRFSERGNTRDFSPNALKYYAR